MVSIIWTETASDDIESIRKYISRDSAFYANQFIKEIIYKKYRIIYRFDEAHIYILTVHHSARLLSNNDFFSELITE
ncbi:MAG TPA: type II toxin-antitoxin system RelE/ParE family toxin [Parafilimonas sp.]